MKKLYFIAYIALFTELSENLLLSADQHIADANFAEATLIESTHAFSVDEELATPERLNILDANRNNSVNCSLDFIIPNDDLEQFDESIKITKNYAPNSLSIYEAHEFIDNSRNAASVVCKFMQNKLKETNEKHKKEINQYVQKYNSEDNEHPLSDPQRWTLLPLPTEATVHKITWNIPVFEKLQLHLNSNIKTKHDIEMINHHGTALLNSILPHIIDKNALKKVLQEFQTKMIIDADQFNQTVITKLNSRKLDLPN